MVVRTPENLCVICGNTIPEGKQYCPICGSSEGDCFEKAMSRPIPAQPDFKVNDAAEQAFRQGYTAGFNEGMKHTCEVKADNERLKRENAFLRGQLEARSRIDDMDGEYE